MANFPINASKLFSQAVTFYVCSIAASKWPFRKIRKHSKVFVSLDYTLEIKREIGTIVWANFTFTGTSSQNLFTLSCIYHFGVTEMGFSGLLLLHPATQQH